MRLPLACLTLSVLQTVLGLGQDQDKRPAGQEERGAAEAAGRPE